MTNLPLIRSGERVDFKRCHKKWYWAWRKGLVPRRQEFGALSLGTWVHDALAGWYSKNKTPDIRDLFAETTAVALSAAVRAGAVDYQIEKAEELALLGSAMISAYATRYGKDPDVTPIAAEIPLEFEIGDDAGNVVAKHRLKPDLVYADKQGDIWLLEHKTAKSISTDHLPLDDQARPYGVMTELALRKQGIIDKRDVFRGITYNFLRKALPDERPTDAQGHYLNKNGSVSKSQPPAYFLRYPVTMTRRAKVLALERIGMETRLITDMAAQIRSGEIDPALLFKTPHKSCARFCDYFEMCKVEEQGGDIREMQRSLYVQQNPYEYVEDTADERSSFEMG